ncbi:MAG: flavodoxin family protein, partial [Eubacteriales bacterium]
MSKKVIIISSSPRKNGNSDTLAAEFEKGAASAGNTVEKINVRELDLKFCIGCQFCQTHGTCVQKDSMNGLYEKIQNADVIVFATPVYYYAVSGQLKTFL